MAVDNRPFKSKEQDGQGNEVIIRDQQLVEQDTTTTMPAGTYFQTLDVDGRPVKIPRDNMMNIVLECIGIILNDSSRNLGTNVQKALGLQGNTVGHSTVADFASVLGGYNTKPVTLYENYVSAIETSRSTKVSSGWGLFEGQNGYGNEIGWYGFVNSSGKAQCILFNAPSIGSITKGFYDGSSWTFYTLT